MNAIYNILAWSAQALALAILAAAAGRFMPHPRARLIFAQSVLVFILILPAIEPWTHPSIPSTAGVTIATGPSSPVAPPSARSHFEWRAEYLIWIAAFGAAIRLASIGMGLVRLRAHRLGARRLETPPVPFERGAVNWYVSDAILSPVTFGWRTPSILLPARIASLPDDLKEAIACHELIHVERRDWLFVLAEEFLRALLWFEPSVWILLGEIQLAREQVVDAEVIRLTRDRDRYLDALVAVAAGKFQPDLAPAPLFLKKRHLASRVAQLLKETRMSKIRILATFAGACAIALLAAVAGVALFPLQSPAQTPARVVMINDGPGVTVDPGAPVMHRSSVMRDSVTTSGTVVVQATLDSKGEVTDAKVLSGPDELRRTVLQSVLDWHYVAGPSTVQAAISFAPLPASQSQGEGLVGSRTAVVWPDEPATLKSVQVIGASDEIAQQVRAALPIHEGEPLNEDSMKQTMAAVRQIDSHFAPTLAVNENHEATLRLVLPAVPYPTPMLPVPNYVPRGPVTAPALAAPTTDEPQAAGIAGTLQPGQTPAPAPQRIRVGTNVAQANLSSSVAPAYPPLAKEARIQGVVRLTEIIGKDGSVQSLQVISGHPLLVPAALEAVKQWMYRPTLLNGQPVEVITQVDVTFTLSQ